MSHADDRVGAADCMARMQGQGCESLCDRLVTLPCRRRSWWPLVPLPMFSAENFVRRACVVTTQNVLAAIMAFILYLFSLALLGAMGQELAAYFMHPDARYFTSPLRIVFGWSTDKYCSLVTRMGTDVAPHLSGHLGFSLVGGTALFFGLSYALAVCCWRRRLQQHPGRSTVTDDNRHRLPWRRKSVLDIICTPFFRLRNLLELRVREQDLLLGGDSCRAYGRGAGDHGNGHGHHGAHEHERQSLLQHAHDPLVDIAQNIGNSRSGPETVQAVSALASVHFQTAMSHDHYPNDSSPQEVNGMHTESGRLLLQAPLAASDRHNRYHVNNLDDPDLLVSEVGDDSAGGAGHAMSLLPLHEAKPGDSRPAASCWTRFLINSQLWRSGLFLAANRDESRCFRVGYYLLFQLLRVLAFFFTFHFVRILLMGLILVGHHVVDKNDCESNNKDFDALTSWSGTAECTVCGNWGSRVSGYDADSPQQCIDALMREPVAPDELLARLDQLDPHHSSGVAVVDLSRQCWEDWSAGELEQVLATLKPYPKLRGLNISRPDSTARPDPCTRPAVPPADKIFLFADFLNTTASRGSLEVLDFSRQPLGVSSAMLALVRTLPDLLHLRSVLFHGTVITDDGMQLVITHWLDTLHSNHSPSELDLSACRLSASGIAAAVSSLSSGAAAKTITSLDFGANLAAADTLGALSAIASLTNLTELRLTGTDLSLASDQQLAVFGAALSRCPAMQRLALDSSSLGDTGIFYLTQSLLNVSSLQVLDVADNGITSTGIISSEGHFGALLQHVRDLSIGRNLWGSSATAVQALIAAFNASATGHGTQSWALSVNSANMDDQTFPTFANSMIATNPLLHRLDVSGNNIGAEGAALLAAYIQHRAGLGPGNGSDYLSLYAREAGLGANASAVLLASAVNGSVQTLDLSGNVVQGANMAAAAAMLSLACPLCHLADLRVENAQLDGLVLAALASVASCPACSLARLSLAENALPEAGLIMLAQNIAPALSEAHKLGDAQVEVDFQRTLFQQPRQSRLRYLNVQQTSLTEKSARALCRAWKLPMNSEPVIMGSQDPSPLLSKLTLDITQSTHTLATVNQYSCDIADPLDLSCPVV